MLPNEEQKTQKQQEAMLLWITAVHRCIYLQLIFVASKTELSTSIVVCCVLLNWFCVTDFARTKMVLPCELTPTLQINVVILYLFIAAKLKRWYSNFHRSLWVWMLHVLSWKDCSQSWYSKGSLSKNIEFRFLHGI